eukprot:scaffold58510_cov66-Phaeocystis_antarctica.AAC.6
MKVLVHVKEKCIPVSVGNGDQPVRWLANVGIARHDDHQGLTLGLPVGVKAEDGSLLNMDSTLVAAKLTDMQHVWVTFKDHKDDAVELKSKPAPSEAEPRRSGLLTSNSGGCSPSDAFAGRANYGVDAHAGYVPWPDGLGEVLSGTPPASASSFFCRFAV